MDIFPATEFPAFSQLQISIVFRKFRCRVTRIDIDPEKYEISKDLEISVKACGARFGGVLSKFKFDRKFESSRRLLTVETGARASDIKRLARSFDQALSF